MLAICTSCRAVETTAGATERTKCGGRILRVHQGTGTDDAKPPRLRDLGYINENELTQFLSKEYGIPAINLSELELGREFLDLVPASMAREHRVIPVNRAGASLILAMEDPSNIFAIDAVRDHVGLHVEMVVCSKEALGRALARYYPESNGQGG